MSPNDNELWDRFKTEHVVGEHGMIVRELTITRPAEQSDGFEPMLGHLGYIARIGFTHENQWWQGTLTLGVGRNGERIVTQMMLDTGAPTPGEIRGRGVTDELLRAIPMGRIQSEIDRLLMEAMDVGMRDEAIPEGLMNRRRPGRRGRTDEEWAVVAACYVDLLGKPNLYETMATKLYVSERTARNMVSKAREKGFLTNTKQGRAGGELTSKTLNILRQTTEEE